MRGKRDDKKSSSSGNKHQGGGKRHTDGTKRSAKLNSQPADAISNTTDPTKDGITSLPSSNHDERRLHVCIMPRPRRTSSPREGKAGVHTERPWVRAVVFSWELLTPPEAMCLLSGEREMTARGEETITK